MHGARFFYNHFKFLCLACQQKGTGIFMVIYKITNLLNGKVYVGQSQRPIKDRIRGHLSAANHFERFNSNGITYAIHNYGWENFKIEILEVCNSQSELNEREKFWIEKLNSKVPNGYNLTDGGAGALGSISRKGKHLSAEHRAKISASEKGKVISAETKAKLSKANIGKKASAETRKKLSIVHSNISDATRKKLSDANKGRIVTAETRKKISLANKGKIRTPEMRKRMSESHKGKPLSEEQVLKIKSALKGRVVSEETKAKISTANKGKNKHKNKIS